MTLNIGWKQSALLSLIIAAQLYSQGTGHDDGDDLSLEGLLNTKISTSAKYEQRVREAAASVTVVTAEDIDRYGYRNLEEVLASVQGFYLSNDRNYTYLGVRGFGRPTDYNNRVLLLVNGHSTNEDVYWSAMIDQTLGITLDSIERVEIVRGPGSVLYGTGAMFAVVNIITKEGKAIHGFDASGEIGSFGSVEAAVSYGKELNNGADMMVSLMWGDVKGTDQFYPEYDDPSTNDGIADDLDWERYYGLQTRVTYQNLSLQGIWSLRQAGIPTGAWEIVFNDRTAQTKDQSGFVELKYDLDLAVDKNLMIRGYYDHYGYAGTYPYEIDSTIVKNYDASDGRWLGGETQFRWDIRTNNRLSLGLEFQKHVSRSYQLWTPEEIYFDGDFPSHVVSFYAQDELQLVDNLAFTFGLRSDKYSNLESHITPRAALVYNPMPYSAVKLLYGQAYRAPNIYEMYYEDPLIGYKPNLALDREKIQTLELVWEHRITEGLFGTLSLYNYKMNDLIEQSIDPIDSSFQYRNIGRVVTSGVEVDFHARVKQKLHGYVNYSLQKAMNSDLEVKLTNSPTHLLKLGLWYPAMNYLSLAAEWQYESERLTLQDTRTRPFLLTNLKLSTRQLFKDARLSLIVRNVFDVDYQTPAGYEHRQAAITQSGRDVTLRLELTK